MTTNATSKTWISCADTAKHVRSALKKAFPGQKFSVRSNIYSGGASIDVRWVDGPTAKQVDAVTGAYAGGRFDGMIDLAYSVSHWFCPEHGVTLAHSPGTEGSRGSDPSFEGVAVPCMEAQLVRFGANYVFANRDHSEAFEARMLGEMAEALGEPVEFGRSYAATVLDDGRLVRCTGASEYGSTLFHQYVGVRSVAVDGSAKVVVLD